MADLDNDGAFEDDVLADVRECQRMDAAAAAWEAAQSAAKASAVALLKATDLSAATTNNWGDLATTPATDAPAITTASYAAKTSNVSYYGEASPFAPSSSSAAAARSSSASASSNAGAATVAARRREPRSGSDLTSPNSSSSAQASSSSSGGLTYYADREGLPLATPGQQSTRGRSSSANNNSIHYNESSQTHSDSNRRTSGVVTTAGKRGRSCSEAEPQQHKRGRHSNASSSSSSSRDDEEGGASREPQWPPLSDLTDQHYAALAEAEAPGEALSAILSEPNASALANTVEALGIERTILLLKRTAEVEAQGGVMTGDGARRRTPGGVFFHLLKAEAWVDAGTYKAIFAERTAAQNKRKNEKRRAAAAWQAISMGHAPPLSFGGGGGRGGSGNGGAEDGEDGERR